MKRDMNLVRDVVIAVGSSEGQIQIDDLYTSLKNKGFSKEQIDYHIVLLVEAEYLKGPTVHERIALPPAVQWMPYTTLTWKGQEFLSNVENDTIWKKVMAESRENGKSVSITILNALLTATLKKHFGL